jgi:hypothetical protein
VWTPTTSEVWSLPSLKVSCFAYFLPGHAVKIGAYSDRRRAKRTLLSPGELSNPMWNGERLTQQVAQLDGGRILVLRGMKLHRKRG